MKGYSDKKVFPIWNALCFELSRTHYRLAKTNLTAILQQHGLGNVRSL